MNTGLSGALLAVVRWSLLSTLALTGLSQALAQAPSPVGEKVTLGPWAIDRTEVTLPTAEHAARRQTDETRPHEPRQPGRAPP